ncbi:hypothetical protein CPB84DRAFT_1847937 [Gymnopilus junonius]|uniref:Uncharacterized protein n=1 Tax=Gymnopilus junonius TaxID=109634 RepID=A0A9P5NMW4_GYMJU|nr:hypothetical protein CPB84DRAFT_1847937 [Gymnopilus junonius]
MTTSYSLNNWDGGASNAQPNHQTPDQIYGAGNGRNSNWNVSGTHALGSSILDAQTMDDVDSARKDAYAIFGPPNETDLIHPHIEESAMTVPIFGDVFVSLSTATQMSTDGNSSSDTGTRPTGVTDASDVNMDMDVGQLQPATDMPMFVPIPTSALHSPTAKKHPSGSPLLTKLLAAIGAAPGSPTPSRLPSGQRENEKEIDAISLYTTDVHGEDEDDDVIVIESLLQNLSPSKTKSYSETHEADLQLQSSHTHASDSDPHYPAAPVQQHTSLFTPPPSDECLSSARPSSCPPADRLFTPSSSPSPLPPTTTPLIAQSPIVDTPRPRPFPHFIPDTDVRMYVKAKGKEKANANINEPVTPFPKPKKRRIMAYVQVPPLKTPRSQYVALGISSAVSGAGKKEKAAPGLGPPPSAASSSRVSLSSQSAKKTSKTSHAGVPTIKKPAIFMSFTSPIEQDHGRGRGHKPNLTLGDALQASFSHNERVGTLDPGRIGGSRSAGTRGKGMNRGKGKEKAIDWDWDPDGTVFAGPSRIRAGGAETGAKARPRPPVSVASSVTSTTSGSVFVVASTQSSPSKKRGRANKDVDVDRDGENSDDEDHVGEAKKRPRVDIDLTLEDGDEDEDDWTLTNRKKAKTKSVRRVVESDDDEVQIVEVVKTSNPKPRPKQPLTPGRPPVSSLSTRPSLNSSSALMRPPPLPSSASVRPPLSSASMSVVRRPPMSSTSARPLPASSSSFGLSYKDKSTTKPLNYISPAVPISPSKSIPKPKPKPRPMYALIKPSSTRPPLREQSVQSIQSSQYEGKKKEKENARPKSRIIGTVYSYDAKADVVTLVLGTLEPVARDVLSVNLKGLRAEVEIGADVVVGEGQEGPEGVTATVRNDFFQTKKVNGSGSGRVQAPWACPPPRHPLSLSKSSEGLSVAGFEEEISVSVGGPVVLMPGASSTTFLARQVLEQDSQVLKKTKKGKKKKRVIESLFSDDEEEEEEEEEEESGRDVESEDELQFRYDSESSDDMPLTFAGGVNVTKWVQPSASSDSRSQPTAPSSVLVGNPSQRHGQQQQQQQTQFQQPQAPLKKIDLAARYRKNKGKGTASKTARSASSSVRAVSTTASGGDVASSPLTQSKLHAPPRLPQPQPRISAPLVTTPSSTMSMSVSTDSTFVVTRHQNADVDVNQYITSGSPITPSAKALGKRRAISPSFYLGQHTSQVALSKSMSPPPPPYTPPVLQRAFSAAAAAVVAGANINATTNHHHHNHLQLNGQQHLLLGPNADLNVFLVSPIRSSLASGGAADMIGAGGVNGPDMGVGVNESGNGALYSKAYPHSLQLRDEAIILGSSQSDLAHLYSPPGVPILGPTAADREDGAFGSTELGPVHPPQEEDLWATLTDGDGRYTYSTVDPALIGGDMLNENPLFSEEEEMDPVVRAKEVVIGVGPQMQMDVEIRDPSPIPFSPSMSSPPSRSLSASATRPKPLLEVQVQKSVSPVILLPPPLVPYSDSEEDEYIPSDIEAKATIPQKRKRDPLSDPSFSADADAATAGKANVINSNIPGRSITTLSSEFSDVPLAHLERPRRKRVPRRMDADMIPTSELGPRRRKSGSEYRPTTASVGPGGEEEDVVLSDSERSGTNSTDRVVVVKRKKSNALSSSTGPTGLPKALCSRKRGEEYVSSARRPPGQRVALGGKTNLPSVPVAASTPLPALNGPIPETAKYWGSIYSLKTGKKLTSTFVTADMGVDEDSGAPTVVYAPASATVVPSARSKNSKTMAKAMGRVFIGAVQRCWGLGRHSKIKVLEPSKSSSGREKKDDGRGLERRFYVGNPGFLKYRCPELEDPYSHLLESLSPLTSLDDLSDEEVDGTGQEAELFNPGSLEDNDVSRAIALALNACGLHLAH